MNKMGTKCMYQCLKRIITIPTRRYGNYKTIHRPDPSKLKTPSLASAPKLMEIIREKIKLTGPLSVADYMNLVATNPTDGYYLKKEVIGECGDFITSPEISQLFGEILAVWFYSETQKMGLPRPLQLVELGPGRGSLLVDMLRVLGRFKYSGEDLSIHLVEISPTLQLLQANRLCIAHKVSVEGSPHYYEGETISGSQVYWYNDLKKVPRGFSWFVAHEFFDALPIHVFERTKDGWRELLIDIDPSDKLHYRLAAEESNSVRLLVRPPLDGREERLEICARGLGIARQLARRVDQDGGLLLIADYGHTGEKSDTFRAFHKHKLVDPLASPGSADLTADVDFSQLQLVGSAASGDDNRAIVTPPVTQKTFLERCRAETRLQVLLEHTKEENKEGLKSGYKMLTDPDQMGERFKFMAFYPSAMEDILKKYPPLGFSETPERK